jgi:hypothetical protein
MITFDMMKKIFTLQIILALAIPRICVAQQQLKIAGITYNVPAFSADSNQTFTDFYVKSGILPSIKSSHYDLEIKAILPNAIMNFSDRGGCVVIRGNKDSLVADYYMLRSRQGLANVTAAVVQKDPNNADFDLMLIKEEHLASKYLDTALRGFFANRITNLISTKATVRKLKKQGIKVNEFGPTDCCGDILYEVKIGNQFRNFTTNSFYYSGNPKIKQITYGANLDGIVYRITR